MKKKPSNKKDDSNDKYGKASYTAPTRKIQPNEFTKSLLSHMASLNNNLDSRCQELCMLLSDLGQKGARLDLVMATLSSEDIELLIPAGAGKHKWLLLFWEWMEKKNLGSIIYDSQNKNVIEEYIGTATVWGREKGGLKGAIGHILNLKPIFPFTANPFIATPDEVLEVNKQLQDVQQTLKVVMERYLYVMEGDQLYPHSLDRSQLKKQKTQIRKELTKRRTVLADEFIKIGYSNNRAYVITGKLLALSYPFYYKDPDPNNVRSTCTYHKKSK